MIDVYIYGAGHEYNRFSSLLRAYKDKINVLGLLSTEKMKFDSLDGYKLYRPEQIIDKEFDYIIIAVLDWKPIFHILLHYNIAKDKILRTISFFAPYFDLEKFLQLKKENISIFSNFCVGGCIYKELGLEMLSPTINMFCLGSHYLKFIEHLDYYLDQEMEVYDTQNYISETLGVEQFIPKGIIDNTIIWCFNHNVDAHEAVELWNKRRTRVNRSNIAVIMTIFTDEEAYLFDRLPISKKLGIYYKNLDLQSVIYCPEWNIKEERFRYNFNWTTYVNHYLTNIRETMVGRVDWIKFLSGNQKDYLRY